MEIALRPANLIDGRLLQLADSYSPDEISQMLGGTISPAAVAARVQTLLKSQNWLTATQEDQLITLKMKRILIELEEMALSVEGASVQLRILQTLGERLEKRRNGNGSDLNVLYGNQGRLMGQVVDDALSYVKGSFRKEIDAAEWDTVIAEALLHAQAKLAKHQAIEE